MRDILAEIVAKKRGIVAAAKEAVPLDVLKRDLSCGTFRMAEHSCGVRSASRRPLQRRGRFASSIALSGVGQSSSLRRTRERRSPYSALWGMALTSRIDIRCLSEEGWG